MKVGDLVALGLCNQSGQIGIIIQIPERTELIKKNPGLGVYWVLTDEGSQWFTGAQVTRHKWVL